jgi:hypothetical protein
MLLSWISSLRIMQAGQHKPLPAAAAIVVPTVKLRLVLL